IPDLFAGQLVDHCLGVVALFVRVVKHDGTVLRSDIRALPVLSRRVMNREEDTEQIAERDDRRIERDLHDLGVAGRPAADVAIARARRFAARIARYDLFDAVQLTKYGVETPEASAAERRRLL